MFTILVVYFAQWQLRVLQRKASAKYSDQWWSGMMIAVCWLRLGRSPLTFQRCSGTSKLVENVRVRVCAISKQVFFIIFCPMVALPLWGAELPYVPTHPRGQACLLTYWPILLGAVLYWRGGIHGHPSVVCFVALSLGYLI